jgi:hypothetical protein
MPVLDPQKQYYSKVVNLIWYINLCRILLNDMVPS